MIKKVLLCLLIVQQLYFAECDFKCYSCHGDCAAKTEVPCTSNCCYSSAGPVGAAGGNATTAAAAGAATTAKPARKRRHLSTLSPFYDDEDNTMFLADPVKHTFKGCCEATTKDDCKKVPGCYTCTTSLCNVKDSGSLKLMMTSPGMVMFAAMLSMAFPSGTF